MKRGSLVFSILFLVVLLSVSLVAAQDSPSPSADTGVGGDVASAIDDFTSFISPIASSILGETLTGQYLFAKVLFLLIILAVIWTALSRVDFFNEHTWVLVVISLAASILATRWLTTEALIETIILPYSALGIAISAGLPFVLWFLLINVGFGGQHKPSFLRRTAWIFFAVIFIGLWITRRDLMGSAKWVYPVTALLAFIMALIDGTINRFLLNLEIEKTQSQSVMEAVDTVNRKLSDLDDLLTRGLITPAQKAQREKKLKKQLLALHTR